MWIKNNKGIALVISFSVLVVLLILGSVLILRSATEKRSSDEDRSSLQAFYIAEAGGNEALNRLDTLINVDLLNTVNFTLAGLLVPQVQGFVTNANGLGFLMAYGLRNGVVQLTCGTPCNVVTFNGANTNLGAGSYLYSISITQKSNPMTVSPEVWDFFYNFTINSAGTVGTTARRRVLLSGDFTLRVQKDNFARYAVFTNSQGPDGGEVWFTAMTSFSGPVHTNGHCNFAYRPAGTFGAMVTQHENEARFYNNGTPRMLNADSNPPRDIPTFNVGFRRGVDEIPLNSPVTELNYVAQSRGGDITEVPNGIYVPNSGGNLTGGIFVQGDSSIQMGVDGSGDALYTITQGATTKNITVNRATHQTTVETVGSGTEIYNGIPDGLDHIGSIIYVNGAITSLSGTVQKDTQLTVSSKNDVVITDNVVYEDYNAGPPPNAIDKTNLLGIVCWEGNVRIGLTAPDNLQLHSIVMALNGLLRVDEYYSGEPRGYITLLGGVISNSYGAFGTFGSDGMFTHGYGRNYVYDTRMSAAIAPPYFLPMTTFIAFSNDIKDKVSWQDGGI
jgi:Tfp pilus assembly protein PilX